MKATPRKKAKTWYVKDENPELGKVAAALRKFVRQSVVGVKETVNSWGVPTFVPKRWRGPIASPDFHPHF